MLISAFENSKIGPQPWIIHKLLIFFFSPVKPMFPLLFFTFSAKLRIWFHSLFFLALALLIVKQ